MAPSKEERSQSGNSFHNVGRAGSFTKPMLAILADLNGTLMEDMATAQKGSPDRNLHRRAFGRRYPDDGLDAFGATG
jgi:hypothetical protein